MFILDWLFSNPETTPPWKTALGFFMLLSIGVLVFMAVNVGGLYIEDKYFPSYRMHANAYYTNTTTLHIYFKDTSQFAPHEHFNVVKENIYNVSILLDGVVIDINPGDKLQRTYDYTVSNNRHELIIEIRGKNNVTQEYVFSNHDLEQRRGVLCNYR